MNIINATCPNCNYFNEVKLISSKDVRMYSVVCRGCKEKFVIDLAEKRQEETQDFNLPPPEEDETTPPSWMKPKTRNEEDYNLPPPDEDYYGPIPPWVKQKKEKSSLPVIAGVLLIVVFVLGIIWSGLVILSNEEMIESSFGRNGKITGKVVDENGKPIVDAQVEVVGKSISDNTNTNGEYELSNIPGGNQKIRASMTGKKSVNTWALVKGDKQTIDFTLTDGTGEEEASNSLGENMLENTFKVCGIMMAIFAIFALIGGIFAIMKKNYKLALMGAIIGIISIGFVIGSVLSITALFMILKSKDSFD